VTERDRQNKKILSYAPGFIYNDTANYGRIEMAK
jgi:hypothetical protein